MTEQFFHPECFKCSGCDGVFSERLPYVPEGDTALCEACFDSYNDDAEDDHAPADDSLARGILKSKTQQLGPACHECSEPVGPSQAVYAVNAVFHDSCLFCCMCEKVVQGGKHFEYENHVYCESDYREFIAPKCARCHLVIQGSAIKAVGKPWHIACFSCAVCLEPFRNSNFYVHENNPYCKNHYKSIRSK
jgi:hypothetical protein